MIILSLTGVCLLLAGWLLAMQIPADPFRGWERVPAVILSSSLTQMSHVALASNRRPSSFRTWRLDIAFAYEARGGTRVSLRAAPHRIRSVILFGDAPPAEALLDLQSRFPSGSTTYAMVNPADPDEAYVVWWPSMKKKALGWFCLCVGALLVGLAAFKR